MKFISKIKVIHLYFITLLLLLIVIFLKLTYFQIFASHKARQNMDIARHEVEDIYAKRGSIISNDGHKLVFDIEKYNIVLDPMNIPEDKFDAVINILATVLEKDKLSLGNELKEKIKAKKHFYDFKVQINYDKEVELKNQLKELKINKKWIFYEQISNRYQPQGQEFESILGFLNSEKSPVYGVEKTYDKDLKGENGEVRVFKPAVDSLKKYTLPSLIDTEILKEAKPGNDIHLTIDSVMQYAMDDILKRTFENFKVASAMGILIESDTGRVIAMDSYPKSTNKSEIKNRNITDLFEPGSIFKPITVAIAMQEGLINKNTVIRSDGYIKIKDRVIHDHDNSTKGDLPLDKIIAHSGNVAMVKIGQMIDNQVFYNYLENFGFSSKTGIDTAYETSGKLFPIKSFTEVRKSNVSFGQGISMTQLQMLMSLNATINGGKLLKPYVVEKITDTKGNLVKRNKPEIIHSPIDEKTSADIRELLEKVVTSGTGRQVAIDGYRIGGKTGTAQKAGPKGYEKGKYFSSFFAFFPADKPKYSILITVTEPQGAYYGAAVALPPAKEMLEALIKYKGILPETINEKSDVVSNLIRKKQISADIVQSAKKDLENGIMPDLKGFSLRDLVNIIPLDKYPNVKIEGSGVVINQNVLKGQAISSDSQILLELR